MNTENNISALAKRLWELFFRNHVRYAKMLRLPDGRIQYIPVEEVPTPELLQRHLDREITIGAYSLDAESKVNLIAFDVDGSENSRAKVENITLEIYRALQQRGIQPVLEFSGNKGYHILLFLSEPLPAAVAKSWAENFATELNLDRRVTSDPHVEIYPKQELLVNGRIGNLLKVPLGLHLKSRSMSYFCDENLQEITDPLSILQSTISPSQLVSSSTVSNPLNTITQLLGPRMGPGSRHQTFMNVCGFLVRNFWSETDINNLLDELDSQFGPFDLANLREVVTRTCQRFEADEPIVYSLQELQFTPEELQLFEEAVEAISSNPTLLSANKILRWKGKSSLEKARALSDLIRRHMRHQGEYCRDSNNHLYWLKYSSGKLYSTRNGSSWTSMLFSMVRYNQRDSIFRLAEEDLRLQLLSSALIREVKRLSYWDEKKEMLYVNLGGPWVYCLNGDPGARTAVYNGDPSVPVLFDNFQSSHDFPNLLESQLEPFDPWELLLGDVNFSDFESISAIQSKELLKCWILSVLFGSQMATKPLLAILAAPGAGKTTLARRLVKFFEGPEAEVLSVIADKPDSLRSQSIAHRVMCLDNLERSGSRWMADDLNRISTGASIELRQLYTTNEIVTFRPDVFVILTATEVPFTEETVFSRLLPIPLKHISLPKPENELQLRLNANLAASWLGMFDVLDEAVLAMKRNKNKSPVFSNRLADFTFFSSKLEGLSSIDWEILNQALRNLTNSQKIVEAAHSSTLQLLQIFAQTEPEVASRWTPILELWRKLRDIAVSQRPRLRYPATPNQVERACLLLESHLQAVNFELRTDPPPIAVRYLGLAADSSSGSISSNGRTLIVQQRLPLDEL